MLRFTLITLLLAASEGVNTKLSKSAHGKGGSCYGYYHAAGKQEWCWLTSNGKSAWVKHNCHHYDGYSANEYCADAHYNKLHGSKMDKGHCFGRYHDVKKGKDTWCWLTHDGKEDYAKSKCSSFDTYSAADWCYTKSSSKSSGLGAYITKWTKSTLHSRVKSVQSGWSQTECWDLGMRAIEKARNAGYKIPRGPSVYEWSNNVVYSKGPGRSRTGTVSSRGSLSGIKPGDIAQFNLWGQKVTHADGSWNTRSTGWVHTAVVTNVNVKGCKIETYDQNPDPVHVSVYSPCSSTGGTITIYRLKHSSRLYEDDGWWPAPPKEDQEHSMLSTPLLCAAVVAISSLFGLGIWRVKKARATRGHMQLLSTEEEELEGAPNE